MDVGASKMEKVFLKFKVGIFLVTALLISSCATKILEVENAEEQLKISEYDKSLKLKELPPEPVLKVEESKATAQSKKEATPKLDSKKEASNAKVTEKIKSETKKKLKKHLPELEGQAGFDGRRPLIDPFVPGEKVTLKLSYFNVVAGTMDLEVLPFVQVNGRKSYRFRIAGKSNSLFSNFYSVDDSAETFLDYETMLPYNMSISVKETKQLREIRSYFDWKKNKASYWEKKITKKHGLEERQFEWDIEPYAQNILSAAFYMRVFPMEPGQVIQFRVADNKKNMVVKGHILKREKLVTPVGEINTIKMKPEVEIDGIFKPIGDVFFWLTDDDRKMVVRIESKIKIGTIIASLAEIKRE